MLRICPLVIWGRTIAVYVESEVERCIDVVELWAGVRSVAKAALRLGLSANAIENEGSASQTEDLRYEAGFLHAVNLALQLRVGGLLWMAPVCSSFVWLGLSHSKRCAENDFRGDHTNEKVQEGNSFGEIAAFLLSLAWARGVHVSIENPPGSTLWKFPPP